MDKLFKSLAVTAFSMAAVSAVLSLKTTHDALEANAGTITYETPLYLSATSFGSSTLEANQTLGYSLDNAPTHKSVAFVVNIHFDENLPKDNVNFYFTAPYDGTDWNWYNEGCMIFNGSNNVILCLNDDNGAYKTSDNMKTGHSPKNFVAGTDLKLEYGRQAILDNGTFTGKYHVYVKIDDQLVNEVDQKIKSPVCNGGVVRFTGSGYTVTDAFTHETGKQITVSDLMLNKEYIGDEYTISEAKTFTYDNSDHATNYSLVYKFQYYTNDSAQNQFHLTAAGATWDEWSSFIINNDGGKKVHLGKAKNSGYYDILYTMNAGTTYNVEFGRLANMIGNNFAGSYYLYLKINNTVVKDATLVIPSEIAQGNIVFITADGKNTIRDFDYVVTPYEKQDIITVSELLSGGSSIGGELSLTGTQRYTYKSTKTHKSVAFRFIYDCKTPSTVDCQFHFNTGWINPSKGVPWFRNDNFYISKEEGGYAQIRSPFTKAGLYECEVGKQYIQSGADAGKYRIYIMVNGSLLVETIVSTMPDEAAVFTTGDNGDSLYDPDYMPTDVTSKLYVYDWDSEKSGIEFDCTFRKDLFNFHNYGEVGFYIAPVDDPTNTVKIPGKLVSDGNNYVVKAAVAAVDENNITKDYIAKFYVFNKDTNKEEVSKRGLTTSYYSKLSDLSGVSSSDKSTLESIKGKVLDITVDEDTWDVNGATLSSGAFTSTAVVNGSNSSYTGFVVNGKALVNNGTVQIGYTTFKTTLGSKSVTFTKQDSKIIYGASEHFVELNSGHDPDMNAMTLSPMITEMGIKTVRLDVYLGNIFSVTDDDNLIVNKSGINAIQGVIDTLKEDGGAVDFLAVLWVVVPNDFRTWEGKPWDSSTAPNPSTQPEMYLRWLKLNEKAVKLASELLPDINYWETWNEPEIMGEEGGPLARPDGTNYSITEKAKILTDLMYYYNRGLKAANPTNILTTPSICCAQISKADAAFDVSSTVFLEEMYKQIVDNNPVPGFTTADKDPNNYFQVINFHPYITEGTTVKNWKAFVEKFHTISVQYGDGGTELWITEFGFAQNRYGITQTAHADNSKAKTDMMSILAYADQIEPLTRFYFYKVHDYGNTKGTLDNDEWGLYYYDGTIKPIGVLVRDYINPQD